MFGVLHLHLLEALNIINFVDDFSNFLWIYLMHDCIEVSSILLQFHAHVERLLDTKIKCVLFD